MFTCDKIYLNNSNIYNTMHIQDLNNTYDKGGFHIWIATFNFTYPVAKFAIGAPLSWIAPAYSISF